MKNILKLILISTALWFGGETVVAQTTIDLSGKWQFQLDIEEKGHSEKWFLKKNFTDEVQLPGTTDTNKKGFKTQPWPADSITRKFEFPKHFENPKWVYELNAAPSRKYKYIGAAWYQKEIEIPANWDGKRMELFLERSLFKVELWVDGQKVGENVSLYAPRRFDITDYVKAGSKQRITLCINNTNLIGGFAHGYTYHTQTNWNGVVGLMEIRKHDQAYIESSRIFTDIYEKNARIETTVSNHSNQNTKAKFTLNVHDKKGELLQSKTFKRNIVRGEKVQEFFLPMAKDIVLWDEFTPELYTLSIKMEGLEQQVFFDEHTEKFGFRKISTNGTTVLVNDRPTFFRGTIDCAIYPKTGYMPMDKESWRKVLGAVKEHGMNHLRYHSVCPPKAAFEVADELGVYLQAELIWGPEPSPKKYVLEYLYNDGFKMLKEYGNHASFTFMALGNEMSYADNISKNRVVNAYRDSDSRRLYSTQAGHVKKIHSSSDIRYNKIWENGESCNIPREKLILNNDFDFSKGKGPNEPPLIIHENGQWVMHPGFDFMKKYDGVKQPDNFYPLYEKFVENGLKDQDKEMAIASGKHGVWHTKQVFESMFRTEGVAGFQYLSLSDFPGQSEAMIGILDPFWDSKGYVTPEKFREFCSETIPLLRFKKWVYTNDEIFEAKASVSNFGPEALTGKTVNWRIVNENEKTLKKGQFKQQTMEQGSITKLGSLKVDLIDFEKEGQYKVQLRIAGTNYKNEWDFYVYPSISTEVSSSEVYTTNRYDAKAQQILKAGGKVLLLWPTEDYGKNVQKISFTPHFWSFNRGTLGRSYPGTAGMLVNSKHSLFKDFTTQSYADARWMDLIHTGNAFILNKIKKLKPLVQIIDDFHRNNKLAAVFEVKVGKGKLLACALDIETNLENRPAARQFRKSILNYMDSKQFSPEESISNEIVTNLLPNPQSINRVVEGSSRWPLHDYRDVLDGNPNTFWSSEWNGEWRASYKHHIIIELGREKTLSGCKYTPRQDSENGRVGEYEIYLSEDGENWGEPVAKGEFKNSKEVQKVQFSKKQKAKFVKFVSLKEVNNRQWAAVADLVFEEY
ncbi:MAG: discoidin domain-containing protein [Cellulophaga sp.]